MVPMPQPLTDCPTIKEYMFEGPYSMEIITLRPNLALAAFEIIRCAAAAETLVGHVVTSLAPEDGVPLSRFYASLQSDGNKYTAANAIASALLSRDHHATLQAILQILTGTLKKRHPFAHHRYGWSVNDDTALL